jgi:hypothetical protein
MSLLPNKSSSGTGWRMATRARLTGGGSTGGFRAPSTGGAEEATLYDNVCEAILIAPRCRHTFAITADRSAGAMAPAFRSRQAAHATLLRPCAAVRDASAARKRRCCVRLLRHNTKRIRLNDFQRCAGIVTVKDHADFGAHTRA